MHWDRLLMIGRFHSAISDPTLPWILVQVHFKTNNNKATEDQLEQLEAQSLTWAWVMETIPEVKIDLDNSMIINLTIKTSPQIISTNPLIGNSLKVSTLNNLGKNSLRNQFISSNHNGLQAQLWYHHQSITILVNKDKKIIVVRLAQLIEIY